MDKFSVNFKTLEESLKPQAPIFRFEDVKHRLKKVAFDIVRFVDSDDIDGLWQIKHTDEGDVIVAMYSDHSDVEKTASGKSDWQAVADRLGNINLFYKSSPVTKVSLAKMGMSDEDPHSICTVLSEKLTTNTKLLKGLLASLSAEERNDLFGVHPELAEVANRS